MQEKEISVLGPSIPRLVARTQPQSLQNSLEMDRDLAEATELLFHSYATALPSGKHAVSRQGMAKLASDCALMEERTGLTFDEYEEIISRCNPGGEGQVSRDRGGAAIAQVATRVQHLPTMQKDWGHSLIYPPSCLRI